MALNLVEELEEDDEAGWVISLNGLVAILMCFILLLCKVLFPCGNLTTDLIRIPPRRENWNLVGG